MKQGCTAQALEVSRPPAGEGHALAPGVAWVRLPLPYALDHINVWLLADGDGWTLVDTGQGDAPTRAAWERLSRSLLEGRPVRRVVVTHHHPDHVGLAGWMAESWRSELWCTRTEWLAAREGTLAALGEQQGLASAFYARAGVPQAAISALREWCRAYPAVVSPVPPSFRRLADGDELAVDGSLWRVVVGRGHTPEQACLFSAEKRILVAGDQVLPHITPNVSVWPQEPEAEPLSEYLETIAALERLPDDVLILPSHGLPFRGLRRRLLELAEHHHQRLDAALGACAERPRTAWEVTAVLFPRDLDSHQSAFAVGESVAHLHHLVARGRLRRHRAPGMPDRFEVAR
jgi:glyoxylase-like metal-dependent hydrolase (beta-lactamase superfamily II)